MIRLKAILIESGRAFVEDSGKFFHIAPPYTLDAYTQVEENDVGEATSGYGFTIIKKEFKTYAELCEYLIEKYNNWKTKNNVSDRTLTDAERLRLMPVAMFKVFLKELQKKFEQGFYAEVQSMATLMLENKYDQNLTLEINELNKLISQCIDHRHDNLSKVFVNLKGISGSAELETLYGTTENSLRLKVPVKEKNSLIEV